MTENVLMPHGKGNVRVREETLEITVPGLTGEYTFVHLTDLHFSCFREGDSPEAVELARARNNFWAIQAGVFADGIDSEDTRIYPDEACEVVAERIRQISPDGVFFTGDTVDFPSVSNFLRARDYLSSLGCETVLVPGNHDHVEEDSDEALKEAFLSMAGEFPKCFSKKIGEVEILGFADGFVQVTAEQVDFLRERLLGAELPVTVLLHAPVFTDSAKPAVWPMWGYNWMIGEEQQSEENRRFRELLFTHRDKVAAVFAGHVHRAVGGEEFPILEGDLPQYVASPAICAYLRVIKYHG